MLKKEQFKKLSTIIMNTARPIDKAYFSYCFFGGSKQEVIHQLLKFQNEDGGFAHGLEADSWNPNSSPLTTSVALRLLYTIKADKDLPIIQKAISYLGNHHYDENTKTWATIIPSNNDYPHAPWWSYRDGGRNTWSFNPSIELAGYILYFAESDKKAYKNAKDCFEKAKEYLKNKDNQLKEHFHEVFNYIAAADITNDQLMLLDIMKYVDETMCQDSKRWLSDYVGSPLSYLRPFYSKETEQLFSSYNNFMIEHANKLIEAIPKNDLWEINWTWLGNYPTEFEEAKNIWKVTKSIEYLALFKKLQLIEGYL